MTLSTYLLYLAAVTVLMVTPGPTMLMCVTNALNHGAARAMASVSGAVTASFVLMGLSAVGLGAVLAASEVAFTGLKVAGAVYLIWLGVRTFRDGGVRAARFDPALQDGSESAVRRAGSERAARTPPFFTQGLLVGLSNPKALLFFAAFFPQFVDPAAAFWPQFFILSLTFVAGDLLVMLACALGVGRVAHLLRRAHVVRWVNRACGGLFALMGGLLLFARRQA